MRKRHPISKKWLISILVTLSIPLLLVEDLRASSIPKELEGAGIVEKLGTQIPAADVVLKDEAGQEVTFQSLLRPGRPSLLAMVYYECPNLCTLVLSGLLDALKAFQWTPGSEFDVIAVSINPKETAELATKKKENYLRSLAKPVPPEGWRFMTGTEEQVRKLADAIGFGYRWDSESEQYAHSAALFVLTPDAVLSRILYGVQYGLKELKLALVEASNGKVGSVVDRILLFCYRYDPVTRKYSLVLTRVMQLACAGMIVVLGAYLGVFWLRQRKKGSVAA